ncbi:MAG: hypothetical protein QXT63_07425 [Thermoplasmata archaeon]
MYDWLTSKVAMSIAAAILVSVVLGFIWEQNRSYQNIGFQNIADEIANACNKVSSSSCNITHLLTSKKGIQNSTFINPTSSGAKYKVLIWRDSVELRQNELTVRARFSTTVHLWKPGELWETNSSSLKDADAKINNNYCISFDSGHDFIIEQKLILVGGSYIYTTFIYLKSSPEDDDSDGLPTWWEITNSLDKDTNDASNDYDNDGLTNAEEFALNTNPTLNDTDKDGISDGQEVKVLHTDPTIYDTDSDGLGDGEETCEGNDGYITNPTKSDTDGDGYSDGLEDYYGTDPTLSTSHP